MKIKFLSFLFAFVLTLALASCSSNTPTGDIDKDVVTLVDKLRDVSGEDELNNYITVYKQYLDYYDHQGNKKDFQIALDNATIEDPNLKTKMFKVIRTVVNEKSNNNPITVESATNEAAAAAQAAAQAVTSNQAAATSDQGQASAASELATAQSEPAACSKCGGSGKVKCSKCGGKGYYGHTVPAGDGWEELGCRKCGGSGSRAGLEDYMHKGSGKMKCPKCHGSGKE